MDATTHDVHTKKLNRMKTQHLKTIQEIISNHFSETASVFYKSVVLGHKKRNKHSNNLQCQRCSGDNWIRVKPKRKFRWKDYADGKSRSNKVISTCKVCGFQKSDKLFTDTKLRAKRMISKKKIIDQETNSQNVFGANQSNKIEEDNEKIGNKNNKKDDESRTFLENEGKEKVEKDKIIINEENKTKKKMTKSEKRRIRREKLKKPIAGGPVNEKTIKRIQKTLNKIDKKQFAKMNHGKEKIKSDLINFLKSCNGL